MLFNLSHNIDKNLQLTFQDTLKKYDNIQIFYRDIGFNDDAINRLRPYFSSLETFVDYDVFAIIEPFETDILDDEEKANKFSIQTQQDFFEALCLFGFKNE